MKPRPLKDKELYDGFGKRLHRFSEDDVKSAVEWLKLSICPEVIVENRKEPCNDCIQCKRANEAFEDVSLKGK